MRVEIENLRSRHPAVAIPDLELQHEAQKWRNAYWKLYDTLKKKRFNTMLYLLKSIVSNVNCNYPLKRAYHIKEKQLNNGHSYIFLSSAVIKMLLSPLKRKILKFNR